MQVDVANEAENNSNENTLDLGKLDHSKLLGFRNLIDVTGQDVDLGASADLAFQKRGTEGASA